MEKTDDRHLRLLRTRGERLARGAGAGNNNGKKGRDPQAWLADILACIADHPSQRLNELLPWHWKKIQPAGSLAA